MKPHIMISLGLLMLMIFGVRLYLALASPGIGIDEAYAAGGLILAGWLIRGGISELKHARRRHQERGDD